MCGNRGFIAMIWGFNTWNRHNEG